MLLTTIDNHWHCMFVTLPRVGRVCIFGEPTGCYLSIHFRWVHYQLVPFSSSLFIPFPALLVSERHRATSRAILCLSLRQLREATPNHSHGGFLWWNLTSHWNSNFLGINILTSVNNDKLIGTISLKSIDYHQWSSTIPCHWAASLTNHTIN